MGNETSVPALQNPTSDICPLTYNKLRTDLQDRLNTVRSIDVEIAPLRSRLASLNSQKSTFQSQLNEVNSQLVSATNRASKQAELDTERTTFNTYISSIARQYAAYGVQPTSASILSKIDEYRRMYQPYTDCTRYTQYCQTYIDFINKTLTPIEKYINDSLTKQRSLESQLSGLSDGQVSNLTNRQSSLQTSLNNIERDITSITTRLSQLENQKKSLDSEATINESIRVINTICG